MTTVDWNAVGAIATGIGVIGGLVFNGVSIRQARRQSIAAAKRAEAAATLASDNGTALVAAIQGLALAERAARANEATGSSSYRAPQVSSAGGPAVRRTRRA